MGYCVRMIRTPVTKPQVRNTVLQAAVGYLGGVGTDTVTMTATDGTPVVASWANGFRSGSGTADLIRKIIASKTAAVGIVDGEVAICLDLTNGQGEPTLVCRQRRLIGEGDPDPLGATTGIGMLTADHADVNASSGTALALSGTGAYPVWYAFSSSLARTLYGTHVAYGSYAGYTGPTIGYAFNTAVTLNYYRIHIAYNTSTHYRHYWPSGWRLYGSNEASAANRQANISYWTLLDTRTAQTPPVDLTAATTYTVPGSPAAYKYYLLQSLSVYCNGTHGSPGWWPTLFGNIDLLGNVTTAVPVDVYKTGDGNVFEGSTVVWRVYIGRAQVSAGVIASVTEYALLAEASELAWQEIAAGQTKTFTHNIGVAPREIGVLVRDPATGAAFPAATPSANWQQSGYGVGIIGATDATVTVASGKDGIAPAAGGGNEPLVVAHIRAFPCRRGW